eukprot:scaffold31982_cov154-Skeletonema_menzelii.AAC.1
MIAFLFVFVLPVPVKGLCAKSVVVDVFTQLLAPAEGVVRRPGPPVYSVCPIPTTKARHVQI